MKKYSDFPIALSKLESIAGLMWLLISTLLLPAGLQFGNALLPEPFGEAMLNFIYYSINFLVVVCIFRHFLASSFTAAIHTPFAVIWYAILGYLGAEALGEILLVVIRLISPGFYNLNDNSVIAALDEHFYLMAAALIVLVPVAEEALYRGVLFRGLWSRSAVAAYLVSMGLFAAIHVLGFVGSYEPLHLLLCFLQYLPAGFCLCWCYRQTGTIICPILMHMIVNAMSIYNVVR